MPMRSPSETAESARRVGSYRGGPGRCLPPVLARGRSGEPLFPPLRAALVRRACQAGVARHRFVVTHWPREHLIDQHISRFNADADDPSQVPYHGVWLGLGLLLQSFLTNPLDLLDLADDDAQARHIALQLGRDIRRQHRALRRVQCCKTLRRLAQGWFEVANAQPGEGPLHSVDDARAFPNQAFALPVEPLADGAPPIRNQKFADSPVERGGFEPSVPPA